MGQQNKKESQRIAGLPTAGGHRLLHMGATEPRAMGLPAGWFTVHTTDLTALKHPVRWCRRRLAHRRLGPYAPPFTVDEGPADRSGDAG